MRRMQKITGRSDDMIILRGVNVFPTQIEEIVLRTPGLAPHFQLVLTHRGPAGRADRAGRGAARLPAPSAGRRPRAELVTAVKDTVGVTVRVRGRRPGDPGTVGGQAAAAQGPAATVTPDETGRTFRKNLRQTGTQPGPGELYGSGRSVSVFVFCTPAGTSRWSGIRRHKDVGSSPP